MKDKTLDVFMMVLFGTGGIIILTLAWVQPMSMPERILTISIGSIGICWALIRALLRVPMRTRINIGKGLTEVAAKKKPS